MEGVDCFAAFNQLGHVNSSANEVADCASVVLQRRNHDLSKLVFSETRMPTNVQVPKMECHLADCLM